MKIVYSSKKAFEAFQKGETKIGELINSIEPRFTPKGRIDRIEKTKKQVKVFDSGDNGRANDIIIRKGNF